MAKTLKQVRDAEPFGTTDVFGTRPTFKDLYPTFDDWWRADERNLCGGGECQHSPHRRDSLRAVCN